jgi:hypothetical protein
MFLFLLLFRTANKFNGEAITQLRYLKEGESGGFFYIISRIFKFIIKNLIFVLKFCSEGVSFNELSKKLTGDDNEEYEQLMLMWEYLEYGFNKFDVNTKTFDLFELFGVERKPYPDLAIDFRGETKFKKLFYELPFGEYIDIIRENWIVYSNFVKALNLNDVKLKNFLDKTRKSYDNVIINDFTSAIELDLSRLFKFTSIFYKTFTDEYFTIGGITSGIGADKTKVQDFFVAMNAPFKNNNIGIPRIVEIYAKFVIVRHEVFTAFKDILYKTVTNIGKFFIKLINPLDLSFTERIKYLIEGFQQYINHYNDCNLFLESKDSAGNIKNSLNDVSTNGIPVQTIIRESFGEEKLKQTMDLLIGITNGTDSIFETFLKILNLTGNEALVQYGNEFQSVFLSYEYPDADAEQWFGDVETLFKGENNGTFINEYKELISELTDREFPLYNCKFVQNLFNKTPEQLETEWNTIKDKIYKISTNQSFTETLDINSTEFDEIKSVISEIVELIETDVKIFPYIKEKTGIDIEIIGQIFEQINVGFGTIDSVTFSQISFINQIHEALSEICNAISYIKDKNIVQIIEYFTGQTDMKDKLLQAIDPVNKAYYPKDFLKQEYYLNQVKTIDNLNDITVPSFGNIVGAIVCGEKELKTDETQKTFLDTYPLQKMYTNFSAINTHIMEGTLTARLLYEYHGYSITDMNTQSISDVLFSTNFSIKEGSKSSETSAAFFQMFNTIVSEIQQDKLKLETIENIASQIKNIINPESNLNPEEPVDNKSTLIIVAAVAAVVVVVIIIIAIVIAKRKKRDTSDLSDIAV